MGLQLLKLLADEGESHRDVARLQGRNLPHEHHTGWSLFPSGSDVLRPRVGLVTR